MAEPSHDSAAPVLTQLDKLLPELEALYKDIHAHPELSMQETRTAGIAAERLKQAGYEVTTGVGKTGVVGPAAQRRGADGDAARRHGCACPSPRTPALPMPAR